MFHISLLKRWQHGAFIQALTEAEDDNEFEDEGLEHEEEVQKMNKILCWRIVKQRDQQLH